MKRAATLIITIITFLDGVVSLAGTPCTVTSGACGITIFTQPSDFIVNASNPVDPSTVQGSDLRVNGVPAGSVVTTNGNTTIDFHFSISPVVPGRNIMHIPAGAFDCGPVVDFTCEFRCIVPRPRATPRTRPTPPL